MPAQYQVVVLGKRGNRLFIGGADPTDQEAAEQIKFATQLAPDWVIVEHDKLAKLVEAAGATATETMDSSRRATSSSTITDDVTAQPEARRRRQRGRGRAGRQASCRRC